MIRKVFGWFLISLLTYVMLPIVYVGASANDFVIKDFQADYYLDVDSNGRSSLITTEVITALFPDYDQNHGIERALVTTYDGHSTNLQVQSVKDGSDQNLNYSTSWQNDNLVLRIGNTDEYVHGLNIYKINYTQNDVTKFFSDTNSDEFYWDINGTGWYQSFDSVSSRLHLGSNIAKNTTEKVSCYYGASGAVNSCETIRDGDVIKTTVNGLSPGENVTIAVGFKAGTFAAYKMTFWSFLEKYLAVMAMILGLLGTIAVLVVRLIFGRDYPSKSAIVAEYIPPKGSDIILSSVIKKSYQNWVAAGIVDLAVRHKIRIVELEPKKYSLEYISSDNLNDNELSLIKSFFGDQPVAGATYEIDKKRTNTKLAYKLSALYRQVKRWATSNDYYLNKKPLKLKLSVAVSLIAIIMLVALLFSKPGITLLGDLLPVVLGAVVFTGVVIVSTIKPLSAKGKDLQNYLKGLEMYINVAEKDRLKMLQSPTAADKKPINTDDKRLMLRLYERVLPYAVLFGSQKEWVKTLGTYYEEQATSPDWYSGNGAFNAVVFSSAITDLSSSVRNNSYISSSGSSSSGGSMGGGFSGGGGGGGGGGGW